MGTGTDGNADEEPAREPTHYVDAREAQNAHIGNNTSHIDGNHNTSVTGNNNTLTSYFYFESAQSGGTNLPPVARALGENRYPYRGLNAFRAQHAQFFFGREATVAEILERMSQAAGGTGMLVVSGASGAGKSSLLQAGVLPRLGGEGLKADPGAGFWPSLLFTPGQSPLAELAAQAARLPGTADVNTIHRDLRDDPLSFALIARQAALGQAAAAGEKLGALTSSEPFGRRLLLVVDQFEQVFTQCRDDDERRAFISALGSAAHGPGSTPSALVVLGVRADFETRCALYPELQGPVQDRYLVTQMTERELREAITGPARKAGAQVDPGLTNALLDEMRAREPGGAGTGVLPLLSHALDQAWRHQAEPGLLTLDDYNRTGGIEGAVAASAERAYHGLTPGQQSAARQIFVRLVATSPDGVDTADRSTRAELTEGKSSGEAADVEAVLEAFAAERLLTLGADSVEISHEALLTAWPLLRDTWLEQTRADRSIRARLRDAASEWTAASRDRSYLWSGALLASATATADTSTRLPPLSPYEREFLNASKHASRRRTRRLRAGLAMVSMLALAVVGTGAYSVREQQDAAQHAATVYSTQLAADAQALQATDPGLAARLAVAGYRYAPTEQAANQMYASLDTPLDTVIGTTSSATQRVTTQAHGPLAAAVGEDGTLRLWNLTSGPTSVLDATIRSRPSGMAFSPDGRLLAGACPGQNHGVCLWNLTDPRHPGLAGRWSPPPSLRLRIPSMSISPDGKLLAAATEEGFTLVWSITDPSRPRLVSDLPNPSTRPSNNLAAVAFAPGGGDLLAESILGGATRLWNVTDPARPVLTATLKGGYASIAFNLAGSMLAAAGDLSIGLWRITDPRFPEKLKFSQASVPEKLDMQAVAFSPDGDNLAFTGADPTDTVADLCTLRIPDVIADSDTYPQCTSTGFASQTAAYTSGGALLTGGFDGLVRSWHWPVDQADGVLDEGIAAEQLSPDGRLLAAGQKSGSTPEIAISDLSNPAAPTLDAIIPTAGFGMVQFLSSRVLLIADGNGRTWLWDLRNPRHPVRTAFLGTAAPPAAGSIGADSAGDLADVEGPDGQLHLWRTDASAHATELGSIPGAPGITGILADSQTAFRLNRNTIQWWDTTDPAHPVPRSTSTVPGTGRLDTAITTGTFVIASTTVDPRFGTSDLLLFNVAHGQIRSTATLSATASTQLNLSPDKHILASAGSGEDAVTLWDVSVRGRPQRVSTVSTQPGVSGIAFSPDSKVLAVTSQGTVQLWNIRDPKAPVALGSVTSQIGTGDTDPTFNPGEFPVSGAAFTGHGDTFAMSPSLTTMLIDGDPVRLAAHLCADVATPLSEKQWEQYAPGVPYRRPCP